jgi:mannan endo-1,4-beta-mannosidase
MTFYKRKKPYVSMAIIVGLVISMAIPASAVRNTCKSGMFLGWDGSVSTTGVSTYSPDIVSFDFESWNNSGVGADSITSTQASTIKGLGKTITVSCHMPNPEGGNADAAMSSSDFSTLANTSISSITSSSSSWLQTYKAEIDKIVNCLQKFSGTTVYFRPFHEMNYSWFWWGGKSTSDFKKAWINLYTYIVNTKGCSYVKFVYAPNAGTNAAAYYPGSGYVTWIGIDAYSDTPSTDSNILTAYNAVKDLGKTFGFSEIGPAVGGEYVNSSNTQIKKFDYALWNTAINNVYTSASFFVCWSDAYAPQNNTNGSTLFTKQTSW